MSEVPRVGVASVLGRPFLGSNPHELKVAASDKGASDLRPDRQTDAD